MIMGWDNHKLWTPVGKLKQVGSEQPQVDVQSKDQVLAADL